MDADKKARIAKTAGYICLSLALLNAALAIFAMVDEKNVRSGTAGIIVAASLFVIGMVNLTRSKRRPPPNA